MAIGWPVIQADQNIFVFGADGVHEAAARAAADGIAGLRRDIEVLTGALLAASQVLAAAQIADRHVAMAAVEVFAEEYAAAALMPAGARRKALFAIKGAMIDLSSWLNSAAQEGGVVNRAKRRTITMVTETTCAWSRSARSDGYL